ncbi:hypothetical protein LLG95_18655 [bacterium]|nr:hypothetical protein [bacterium]
MSAKTIIGYWFSSESENRYYIHPKDLIDHDWHADERDKIVQYLKNGIVFLELLGHSHCRFEDGPPPNEMGCCDLTDGIWMWPEALYIYVEKYHVRLPEEFYEHMKKNNFTLPDENAVDKEYRWSVKFWIEWGNRQAPLKDPPNPEIQRNLKEIIYRFLKAVADGITSERTNYTTPYLDSFTEFICQWFDGCYQPGAFIEAGYINWDEFDILDDFSRGMTRLFEKFKGTDQDNMDLMIDDILFTHLKYEAELALNRLKRFPVWQQIAQNFNPRAQ